MEREKNIIKKLYGKGIGFWVIMDYCKIDCDSVIGVCESMCWFWLVFIYFDGLISIYYIVVVVECRYCLRICYLWIFYFDV